MTLAIVTVILTVIMFNQSKYIEGAALINLADEIGLSLSQAQAYGISVRELTPGSDDFTVAYGLSMSLLSDGSNMAALSFADRNSDNIYNGDWSCSLSGASECLEKKNFILGNYIDAFCIVPLVGEDECDTIGRVDVVYVRPNPEAQITMFDLTGSAYSPPSWQGIKTVFKSPSGQSRSVTVYRSGQISVQ